MFTMKMTGEELSEMFSDRIKLLQAARKLYGKLIKRFDPTCMEASLLDRWVNTLAGCKSAISNYNWLDNRLRDADDYELSLDDVGALGFLEGTESSFSTETFNSDRKLLEELKARGRDVEEDT